MRIDFDHTDLAFMQDPYGTFHDLQKHCPVAYSTRFGGFWVLSRYTDIIAAVRDTRTFSSAAGVILPAVGSPVPMVPLEADPPVHSEFRRVLQREFSRGRMQDIESTVREWVNELISGFIDRGSADLAVELASPIPAIIIAQIMGFPRADWERFRDITERLLTTAKAEDIEANFEVALEYCTYLMQELDARRQEPGEDMLTRIAEAEVDGRALTEDEALGMTLLTIVAGHETTVGGIGSLLMHVGADWELKRRLLADPLLIPKAVEETLRMESPIQGMARTVTEDVQVDGKCLRKGDKVWLSFGAGNHDESQFPEPDRFDVDRAPNRHIGFGDGIHRCVGAPLAQLEMRVVLEEVLKRIPDYRIEDPGSIVFGGGQNRLLLNLPASWS
jgi:cytochrome P450